jgi:hypothetical protein
MPRDLLTQRVLQTRSHLLPSGEKMPDRADEGVEARSAEEA